MINIMNLFIKYIDQLRFLLMRRLLTALLLFTVFEQCTVGQATGSARDGPASPFDLKVFFFRNIRQEINDGLNVVQIVPKIGLFGQRVNIYLPVGTWQQLAVIDESMKVNRKTFFFSPGVNGSLIRTSYFDICAGAFVQCLSGKDVSMRPLYGISAGIGFTSPSRRWFCRSEVSYVMPASSPGMAGYNIGFTIGYNLFAQKGRYRDLAAKHDRFFTSISSIFSCSSQQELSYSQNDQ
jgi:hypothetical protein